jgi:hypothetical protein
VGKIKRNWGTFCQAFDIPMTASFWESYYEMACAAPVRSAHAQASDLTGMDKGGIPRREPIMYPGMLLGLLFPALKLAIIVCVPGVAALAFTLATSGAADWSGAERLDAKGCLWVVHELARRACVTLLSVASGLVGAGLASVCLTVAFLAFALIADSVAPDSNGQLDMTLVGVLYVGGLCVGFLIFFALAMSRLVRWLKPDRA